MKKQLLLLIASLTLMLQTSNSYALDISASALEAASLACSDGTKVFGIKGNGVISSALLVEKNGSILYYNPEFEDIQHIQSIYCLQHAIVLTGIHGSYTSTSVLSFNYNYCPYPELVGITRCSPLIEETKGKTTVGLYGDDRQGDGETIIKSINFYKPFQVGAGWGEETVTFSPQIQIAHPVKQTVQLTTITTCCGTKSPDEYTVMAYTDETGMNYVSIKNGDTPTGLDYYPSKYTAALPFTATNSMCFGGETYFFGIEKNRLRAARLSFTSLGKERLESLDPSKAPVRPAIDVKKAGTAQ